MKIYQVGGSVRDKMLGRVSKDLDYAVEAGTFEEMRAEIQARGYKIFLETPKYLTIRAHGPDGPADFSLCRRDGIYLDGRHPEKVEAATIEEDLARRDFSMNAIAVDIDTGEVLDHHCGQADIEAKVLATVGKPEDRFGEDALRAIRGVRFLVCLGFTANVKTLSAIKAMKVSDFSGVSTDRIRDELFKMFQQDTSTSLYWMVEFPELVKLMCERGVWLRPTTEERK